MEQGGIRVKGLTKGRRNDNGPLISVITAVRNGGKTLERTIRSVLQQSWKNIEYIIIDGESTDNTIEIIRKYEEFIEYWISEPDNGIADAWNKGLFLSTGDYISIIGSDDWYEPDSIETIVKTIKPDIMIYTGHASLWRDNGRKFVKIHKSCPDRIFQTMRIVHPATLVSRNIFKQIGKFSTAYKIAIDYDFFLRASLKGYKTMIVDKILVNVLLGGISNDVKNASAEELKIKNTHMGKRLRHIIWRYAYLTTVKFFSLIFRNKQ